MTTAACETDYPRDRLSRDRAGRRRDGTRPNNSTSEHRRITDAPARRRARGARRRVRTRAWLRLTRKVYSPVYAIQTTGARESAGHCSNRPARNCSARYPPDNAWSSRRRTGSRVLRGKRIRIRRRERNRNRRRRTLRAASPRRRVAGLKHRSQWPDAVYLQWRLPVGTNRPETGTGRRRAPRGSVSGS